MARNCWAYKIGGCDGPITGEHIVSSAQLPDRVTLKGLHWCQEEFKTVGRSSCVANVLCRRHNNMLSDVDAEATRFKKFLPLFFSTRKAGKKLTVSDRFHTVNGTLFARWLCKTYCNMVASGKREPSNDFVCYAMKSPTARRMYFCVPAAIGKSLQARAEDFTCREFYTPDGVVLACFSFWGFQWLAANAAIDESAAPLLRDAGVTASPSQLLDRPHSISHRSGARINPRVLGEIRIEW